MVEAKYGPLLPYDSSAPKENGCSGTCADYAHGLNTPNMNPAETDHAEMAVTAQEMVENRNSSPGAGAAYLTAFILEEGGVGLALRGLGWLWKAGRARVAAKGGTATVLDHGGTHASIIVRQGNTVLHTEQVVNSTTKATTIVEVANPGAVKRSVDIALPDAAGALRHQRGALGQPGGSYDVIRNSCVTHCGDVLRAGGVQGVPTTTLDIVRWLRSL